MKTFLLKNINFRHLTNKNYAVIFGNVRYCTTQQISIIKMVNVDEFCSFDINFSSLIETFKIISTESYVYR